MFDMKVLIGSWYIHIACVKYSHTIMVFVELHMLYNACTYNYVVLLLYIWTSLQSGVYLDHAEVDCSAAYNGSASLKLSGRVLSVSSNVPATARYA